MVRSPPGQSQVICLPPRSCTRTALPGRGPAPRIRPVRCLPPGFLPRSKRRCLPAVRHGPRGGSGAPGRSADSGLHPAEEGFRARSDRPNQGSAPSPRSAKERAGVSRQLRAARSYGAPPCAADADGAGVSQLSIRTPENIPQIPGQWMLLSRSLAVFGSRLEHCRGPSTSSHFIRGTPWCFNCSCQLPATSVTSGRRLPLGHEYGNHKGHGQPE